METIDIANPNLAASRAGLGSWARSVMTAGSLLLAVAAPLAAGAAVLPVADIETGEPMALPTPVPDVPSVRPSAPVYGLASSPAPASPNFAPAPNIGPVTGYGAGGMGAMPGAPANPPYSRGGLGGRR